MGSVVLLITSLIFLISSGFFFSRFNSSLHSKLSSVILIIAGFTYLWMSQLNYHEEFYNLRLWRYIDWFLTVPLMIYQMFHLLDLRTRTKSVLIGSLICMIMMLSCGVLGESGITPKLISGVVGIGFALYTFTTMVNSITKPYYRFFTSVLILWLFYPVVYFIEDSFITILLYSIVDLTSKLGGAIYIESKVK